MALTEELKGNIQRCYREWLESNDCKPRRPQREMIAHIARCLAAVETDEEGLRLDSFQNQLCIVQAGTGTGKTLAYSIASIVIAQALDKKSFSQRLQLPCKSSYLIKIFQTCLNQPR